MYVDIEAIRSLAALVTALGTLFGVVIAVYKFYSRQKKQDDELAAIREELQILCYGIQACLSGLKEQGCNGPVNEAHTLLEKHLNKKAHQCE